MKYGVKVSVTAKFCVIVIIIIIIIIIIIKFFLDYYIYVMLFILCNFKLCSNIT